MLKNSLVNIKIFNVNTLQKSVLVVKTSEKIWNRDQVSNSSQSNYSGPLVFKFCGILEGSLSEEFVVAFKLED